MNKKMLMCFNGTLDSIVASWLLRKQGRQLKGVFFDLFQSIEQKEAIEALERRLGFGIQVIDISAQVTDILLPEVKRAFETGKKVDLRGIFQREILFPELIKLQNQMGLDGICTAHRIQLSEDHFEKVTRVFPYLNPSEEDAYDLMGLTAQELNRFEMPLGSIPTVMLEKIGQELKIEVNLKVFEIDWRALTVQLRKSTIEGEDTTAEVVDVGLNPIGSVPDYTEYFQGDRYQHPEKKEVSYAVLRVDPHRRRVIVGNCSDLKCDELILDQVTWLKSFRVGMSVLPIQVSFRGAANELSGKLVEFEGGRCLVKLDTLYSSEEAPLFEGERVLLLQGSEVIGVAIVYAGKSHAGVEA